MKLNNNERKVFKACVENAHTVTGGDFGYPDEVVEMADVLGLSANQIKGYLSILQKKGLIQIDHNGCANAFTIEVKVKPEDFVDWDEVSEQGGI